MILEKSVAHSFYHKLLIPQHFQKIPLHLWVNLSFFESTILIQDLALKFRAQLIFLG